MKKPVHLQFYAVVLFLFMAGVLFQQGCATRGRYQVDPERSGYTERGIASYYSMKFMFRSTAGGERLNNFSMTAAHRTLPFGTKLLVTNVENGRQVVVRVNDRGPFVEGRIIDLTRSAFAKIADLASGLAEVKIHVIK